ncbi:MAG: sigma-70 family RNA polymerase sigma factor [Planctomycetota bacterium]
MANPAGKHPAAPLSRDLRSTAATGPASAEVDAAILQACLAGQPGAWDGFVERFAGLLGHVVTRCGVQRQMALSEADRDDVVAEILAELLAHDAAVLRSFTGRASLTTYLIVISRRVAVRSMCRVLEAPPPAGLVDPAAGERASATGAPLNRPLINREEIEALLPRLDAQEALLVRLHHIEARSYGDISHITGLPLGSIGPALSKARQKMRDAAASPPNPDS